MFVHRGGYRIIRVLSLNVGIDNLSTQGDGVLYGDDTSDIRAISKGGRIVARNVVGTFVECVTGCCYDCVHYSSGRDLMGVCNKE